MKTIVCIGNERLAVPYGTEDTVKSVCKVALKRYLALCEESIPEPPDYHMRTIDNALLDDDDLLASVINPNDEVKVIFSNKSQTMADPLYNHAPWILDRTNHHNNSICSNKESTGRSHIYKKNPHLLSSSITNLTACKFFTAPKLKGKKPREYEEQRNEKGKFSNFNRSSARKSLGSSLGHDAWFEAREKIEENNTSFNGYPVTEYEPCAAKNGFEHEDAKARLFYDSDENEADDGNKKFTQVINDEVVDNKSMENIPKESYDKNNIKINETNIISSSNTRKIGEKIELELIKGAKGFGFTITSRDNMGDLENPVCVKNITTGGVAMLDGRMQLMDRLLTVNGVDVTNSKQAEVTQLLRQIPMGETLKLTISRQSNKVSEKNRQLVNQNDQKTNEEGSSVNVKTSNSNPVELSISPIFKPLLSSFESQVTSETSTQVESTPQKHEHQPIKKYFSTTSINSIASNSNEKHTKKSETEEMASKTSSIPFVNVLLTNVFKSKPQFNPIIKDSRFVGFIVKVNNKSLHAVEIDGVRLDTLSGLSEGENLVKKSIKKNHNDSVVVKLIDPSLYSLYAGSKLSKITNSQTLPKSSRTNRVSPKVSQQSLQQSSQSIDNHKKRPLSSAVKRLSALFFDSHTPTESNIFSNNESNPKSSVDVNEKLKNTNENNNRFTQNQLGDLSNKPTTNKQTIESQEINKKLEKNKTPDSFEIETFVPNVNNDQHEKGVDINNNHEYYDSDDDKDVDVDYFNREAVGRRSVSEKRKGKLNPKNLDIFKTLNKISIQKSCDNFPENKSDIDYATWHGRKLKRSKDVKYNDEIVQIGKQFRSMDNVNSVFEIVEFGRVSNETNFPDKRANITKPTDANVEKDDLKTNMSVKQDEVQHDIKDNTHKNEKPVLEDTIKNGSLLDVKPSDVSKVNELKSLLSKVMKTRDNFSRYKLSLSAKKTNKNKIEKINILSSKTPSKNNADRKWNQFLNFGSLPIKLKSVKKLSESKDNLTLISKYDKTKKDEFSSAKLSLKATPSQTPKIGAATKIYTKSTENSNSIIKNADVIGMKYPAKHEHKAIETTHFPYSPPLDGANRISFTKALSYRSSNNAVTSKGYNTQQNSNANGKNVNKKLSLDQLKIKNIIRGSTKSDSYCINKNKETDLNNNIQKNESPGFYEKSLNHISNFDTELENDLYFVNENIKININDSARKIPSKNIEKSKMSPTTNTKVFHPSTNPPITSNSPLITNPPPTTMFRLYGQRLRPEGKEDLHPFPSKASDEIGNSGGVVDLEVYKKSMQRVPNLKVMEYSNLYMDQKQNIQETEEIFLGSQNRMIKNALGEERSKNRQTDEGNDYSDNDENIQYLNNTWNVGRNYMSKNIEKSYCDYNASTNNNKFKFPQKHANNIKNRVMFSYSQDPTSNKECQNRRMVLTPKDHQCEQDASFEHMLQNSSSSTSTFYVPLRRHSSDNQHEGTMQIPQQLPYKLSKNNKKLSTSQHKLPIDIGNNYELPRIYFQKSFSPNRSYQLAQENPLCLISPYQNIENPFDDIDFQYTENFSKNSRAYQSDKHLSNSSPLHTNIKNEDIQGYDHDGVREPYGLYYNANIEKTYQIFYDDRKENQKNFNKTKLNNSHYHVHRVGDFIEPCYNGDSYDRNEGYYELVARNNPPKHVTKLNVNYDERNADYYNNFIQTGNNLDNYRKNKTVRLINSTVKNNFKTELRVGDFQRSLL